MNGKSKISMHPGPSMNGDPEHFFSLLMGNIPARIWIKDAQGRYVFVNSRLCSELGIEREKWIGSSDDELFPRLVTFIGARTSRSCPVATRWYPPTRSSEVNLFSS